MTRHSLTRLNIAYDLGLRSTWVMSEAHECRAHNRKLWDRLKERNGWYHVDDIPGFLECCEEMFEGGYSASDIAVTFGVSREWIRQVLVSRFGVATQGALVRYWDDDLNQFRAYSLDDLAAMARTRAQTRGERQR